MTSAQGGWELIAGEEVWGLVAGFLSSTIDLYLTLLGSTASTLILAGAAYAPVTVCFTGMVRLVYKAVPWWEDVCAIKAGGQSAARGPIAWLGDLSRAQPRFVEAMRLPFALASAVPTKTRFIGEFWAIGGGSSDAGFLTVAWGLQTFWACFALAPVLCVSIWLGVPALVGTISAEERADHILITYSEQVDGLASFLRALAGARLHPFSPTLLDVPLDELSQLLPHLVSDPMGSVTAAAALVRDRLAAIGQPSEFQMEFFKEGVLAAAKLNVMLIVLKLATMMAAQLWACLSRSLSGNGHPAIVGFTQCVPDGQSLCEARTRLEVRREVAAQVERLRQLRKSDVVLSDLERFLEDNADLLEQMHVKRALETLLEGSRKHQDRLLPDDIRRMLSKRALHKAAKASVGKWRGVSASVNVHYGDGELEQGLTHVQQAHTDAKAAGVESSELKLASELEEEIKSAIDDKAKRDRGEFVSRSQGRRFQAKARAYASLLDGQVLEDEEESLGPKAATRGAPAAAPPLRGAKPAPAPASAPAPAPAAASTAAPSFASTSDQGATPQAAPVPELSGKISSSCSSSAQQSRPMRNNLRTVGAQSRVAL